LFPSVRRLLKEYGINNSKDVKATGQKNRLLKGDVLKYINSKSLKPLPKDKLIPPHSASPSTTTTTTTTTASKPEPQLNTIINKQTNHKVIYEDIPNNNVRRVIATKLTQSKQQVPHFYMTVECELDKVLELRKTLPDNVKVSVNDFVLRACALALRDNPLANAKWSDKEGQVVMNNSVDISFAVSTDRGLITPIIANTDKKQLGQIATEAKELAGKARDGKLKPEEFIGGTFSVSNLGMFGISTFSAIINYPQAGILAIGTGRKVIRSVVSDVPYVPPTIANVVDVTLSGDNRVFDDEIAAKFLQSFKKYLSNP
ncbi:hypothetical protein DICPUDRAFT_8113, partial [Dictyostelium purpureum]